MTGFTDTFLMATVFLIVCVGAGTLVPGLQSSSAAVQLDGPVPRSAETA